ncbi:MAG: DivIVA domain-containing protein [Deltaproteobacteria bacterium]|nr:DivIVA domain-containing protein [Deltaproteobacteria bacterium]
MSTTPLEIKEYKLNNSMLGYDKADVEAMRELAVEALSSSKMALTKQEDQIKGLNVKLVEHEEREKMLKDTITTAQKMVDDLKGNARKEAELIVAEARHNADGITRQAQKRVLDIQGEIRELRKTRVEFEAKMRALLEYHLNILTLETKESNNLDEEAGKLKYLQNK